MHIRTLSAAVTCLLGLQLSLTAHAADQWPPFSKGHPGNDLPADWTRVAFNAKKIPTVYDLVEMDGSVVLHARSKSSVSMVMREFGADLNQYPMVTWRWKLGTLPKGADNDSSSKEDAAARLVLVFEGDRSKLPLRDRTVMEVGDALSGRTMPFATLMYITSSVAPVGTIISNPHTRRVQMVVASRADDGLGHWQTMTRDVVKDYRAAFNNEEPGKLQAYGVMSDSDNTETEAEAWYGDIHFSARP